jgi:phage gpG-like protein
MTSSVKIEIVDKGNQLKLAKRQLRILSKRIKYPLTANKAVSAWLMRSVNSNFESQGGKVGGWEPFALGGRKLPSGQIDRKAKLLQDTGVLRGSFTNFYGRNHAGVGASAPYSIFHELGVASHRLPARRMLPVARDREVIDKVTRIYDVYIKRSSRAIR